MHRIELAVFYLEGNLISEGKIKMLMFRIAFDKSKTEYDPVRKYFQKQCNSDSYKKKNGYKIFSDLLQKQSLS
jgi:hypothetical protein